VSIEVGLIVDALGVQLTGHGLKFDKEKVEHFDKDNAAVSRLVVRGLLTHAEAQKAYARLMKKVTAHLHTQN
jgi:hypothetical protein